MYYVQDKDYVKYLQLPEGITERTVDLVYDLVMDCSNNAEKAKKIRDYLSENYTYTLNASVLPEERTLLIISYLKIQRVMCSFCYFFSHYV